VGGTELSPLSGAPRSPVGGRASQDAAGECLARSGRQPLPAPGAAGGQDPSTAGRSHPGSKAVFLGAVALLWLVGLLHRVCARSSPSGPVARPRLTDVFRPLEARERAVRTKAPGASTSGRVYGRPRSSVNRARRRAWPAWRRGWPAWRAGPVRLGCKCLSPGSGFCRSAPAGSRQELRQPGPTRPEPRRHSPGPDRRHCQIPPRAALWSSSGRSEPSARPRTRNSCSSSSSAGPPRPIRDTNPALARLPVESDNVHGGTRSGRRPGTRPRTRPRTQQGPVSNSASDPASDSAATRLESGLGLGRDRLGPRIEPRERGVGRPCMDTPGEYADSPATAPC